MLSSELGNADKVAHFVAECEAMGLDVMGPDVNESREMFTPVGGRIRFGLAGIKGVGELAAQRIIAEREANGPFADFEDFAARVDGRAVNKRVLEHLVKTGAFDFSRASRRSASSTGSTPRSRRAPPARATRRPGRTRSSGCSPGPRPAERRRPTATRTRRRTSARRSASPSRRSSSGSTSRATR